MEFRDAVVIVIRNDFGEVLFGRRADGDSFPGVWNPITGECNSGESLSDACRRETLEEVGLEITVGSKLWESATSGAPFVLHWFEAQALSTEVILDESEIAETQWLNLESLRRLELVFRDTVEFMERYFRECE